jgi:hypothetical protein
VRVVVSPLQDLLAGPEPQRIILGLSVAENLRPKNVGGQDKTTDEEKDIKRCS